MTLTKEQVDELQAQLKENKKVLQYWNTTTPNNQFTEDLDQL